jgi:hypothetical protein
MTPRPFKVRPIIGQEAVCPDGLGRVKAWCDNFPEQWVQVSTYLDNRDCKWDACNVRLVEIGPTWKLL